MNERDRARRLRDRARRLPIDYFDEDPFGADCWKGPGWYLDDRQDGRVFGPFRTRDIALTARRRYFDWLSTKSKETYEGIELLRHTCSTFQLQRGVSQEGIVEVYVVEDGDGIRSLVVQAQRPLMVQFAESAKRVNVVLREDG